VGRVGTAPRHRRFARLPHAPAVRRQDDGLRRLKPAARAELCQLTRIDELNSSVWRCPESTSGLAVGGEPHEFSSFFPGFSRSHGLSSRLRSGLLPFPPKIVIRGGFNMRRRNAARLFTGAATLVVVALLVASVLAPGSARAADHRDGPRTTNVA